MQMQRVKMRDRIIELVNSNGPVLPVEVASKVGIDSLLANAYLSELVDSGTIKRSEEKVGGANLYFNPSQSSAVAARLKDLGVKVQKTAGMYKASTEKVTPEVAAKRQAFSERLNEIERRERDIQARVPEAIPKSVSEEVTKRLYEDSKPKLRIIQKEEPKPKIPETQETLKEQTTIAVESSESEIVIEEPTLTVEKEEPKVVEQKPEQKSLFDQAKALVKKTIAKPLIKETEFVSKATAFLTEKGANIISKELTKGGKEAELVVELASDFGTNKFYVALRNKKSLNEGDLSLVYTEALNKKLPALILTNGKMTKTAQDYLKTVGGLLKVKTL